MYKKYSNSLSGKKKWNNQMCAYFSYKDCCKLGYFYLTGYKWKEVAQVLQAPKGTLGDLLHLCLELLWLSVFFDYLFMSWMTWIKVHIIKVVQIAILLWNHSSKSELLQISSAQRRQQNSPGSSGHLIWSLTCSDDI